MVSTFFHVTASKVGTGCCVSMTGQSIISRTGKLALTSTLAHWRNAHLLYFTVFIILTTLLTATFMLDSTLSTDSHTDSNIHSGFYTQH